MDSDSEDSSDAVKLKKVMAGPESNEESDILRTENDVYSLSMCLKKILSDYYIYLE